MTVRAVVLAPGKFGDFGGKTANDLVIYDGRFFDVVAILDPSKAGKHSRQFLPIAKADVPIVANLEETAKFNPEAFVIGVAPIGGKLTREYRGVVREAILRGLDVWNGLHTFLANDPELASLAKRNHAELHDLRRPPSDLRIWDGDVLHTKAARIAVMGTDCDVGKNITTLELAKQASLLGFEPGIVATGQTMLMLNSDAGAVIDAIPADFTAGEVERQVLKLDRAGKDLIFIEGQGAVLHPAYGQVSLAILYGSQPHAVCLAHDPFRKWRGGFKIRMPKLTDEIAAIEMLCSGTRVAAISVMGWNRSAEEISKAASKIQDETRRPTGDAFTDGRKLLKATLKRLKAIRRVR